MLFSFCFLTAHAINAQSLTVFDVDTSDYPIMRAKFYAFDANCEQITNLTPADFELTENGEQRKVLSVSPIEKGWTEVALYNSMGEKVRTLLSENISGKGTHLINTDISELSSGIYMLILRTPELMQSEKVMIIK